MEYKRGKPKPHHADEVQLCAQAICLEEVFAVAVPEGALFYGTTRRRIAVRFDDDLRALTAEVARAARDDVLSVVPAAGGSPALRALLAARHVPAGGIVPAATGG